ncbi:hypothetical protein [Spirosoma endophyticum]|uniref:Lipoprotein n=1 Tax=Spirosoma endophyticum TaxID=662367 RepID=A0A1I2AWS6_9BACT|nr:hypothetical protein [Spirosoma endophyticum]SFE47433.1 hypothetical protein SAMN05216167_11488 [Spirosoma endophyticum]
MKTTSHIFLSLSLLTACQNKDATPDCGCDGPTYEVLTDKAAIYKKGTISTLRATTLNVDGSYLLACNPGFIEGKAAENDTVFISGKARANCFKGETLSALPGMLELTEIHKR